MAICVLARRNYFYPDFRKFGYADIRISGNPDFRTSGYPDIRKSGFPDIRTESLFCLPSGAVRQPCFSVLFEAPDGRKKSDSDISGFSDIRISGFPDVRISGIPDTRLVGAPLIHSVPWLKSSHILEIPPLVHAAATDDLSLLCVRHQGHQPQCPMFTDILYIVSCMPT